MGMKSHPISAVQSWLMRQESRATHLAGKREVSFDLLYEHHYPAIFAFLQVLLGTPESAEDVASLVFEKAWHHLADLETAEAARPWLLRIARNCAIDAFRRRKPAVSLDDLSPTQHPQSDVLEEVALAREETRLLLAHLSQLSTSEREVIGLKFAVGLKNREIARILQMREGTVSSLLYRALRRLRSAFTEERGAHE